MTCEREEKKKKKEKQQQNDRIQHRTQNTYRNNSVFTSGIQNTMHTKTGGGYIKVRLVWCGSLRVHVVCVCANDGFGVQKK